MERFDEHCPAISLSPMGRAQAWLKSAQQGATPELTVKLSNGRVVALSEWISAGATASVRVLTRDYPTLRAWAQGLDHWHVSGEGGALVVR